MYKDSLSILIWGLIIKLKLYTIKGLGLKISIFFHGASKQLKASQ